MKLYNSNLSPFASRCRLQIYAKGLEVELAAPPGGLASDEYKQINPTGKVPALEVDGTVIPESHVIMAYLEETHPEPALMPADPLERARVRALATLADLYVMPWLVALFQQFPPNPQDPAVIAKALAEIEVGADRVEAFMGPGPFACGAELTLADCSLVPVFFFAVRIPPALGGRNPLDGRPKLQAWWNAVREHELVARVCGEMRDALAARRG